MDKAVSLSKRFDLCEHTGLHPTLRSSQTIKNLVAAYAAQDLESIMSLFADDAVFCDVIGRGVRGDEYHGKAEIRKAIARQIAMTGQHTYLEGTVMAEGNSAFASWTMILDPFRENTRHKFEGIDQFALNDAGLVVLKKAWLKGQPRLKRTLLLKQPSAMVRYLGYTLRSLVN